LRRRSFWPSWPARRVAGYPHSIGQIVLHMNYWMDYEFRKIAGENPRNPDHAIESWPQHPEPTDRTPMAGRRLAMAIRASALYRRSGETSVHRGFRCGNSRSPGERRKPREDRAANHSARYAMQIVAHNSYHAGQIALVAAAVRSCLPRAREPRVALVPGL